MNTIPFILLSVTIITAGQICMKIGLNSIKINFSRGIILTYLSIFFNPYVFVGTMIYVLGVFLWVYILSKVNLSFAYPFLGLTFVFVAICSKLILKEDISVTRWLGVITISLGVILVSECWKN